MEREQFRLLKKGMVVRLNSKDELLRSGWKEQINSFGNTLNYSDFYEYTITEQMMEFLGQKVVVHADAEDIGDGVMDVWLEDFEGNKIFGLWTPGMIKSCLDLIEAPGLKVNMINPDEEKVGLTINVDDDGQEWLAGFVAGYQMAIEHMRSGK